MSAQASFRARPRPPPLMQFQQRQLWDVDRDEADDEETLKYDIALETPPPIEETLKYDLELETPTPVKQIIDDAQFESQMSGIIAEAEELGAKFSPPEDVSIKPGLGSREA
eukprot:15288874-Heterocapsa_arctica.AAC.1